jgi:hypothetical protein
VQQQRRRHRKRWNHDQRIGSQWVRTADSRADQLLRSWRAEKAERNGVQQVEDAEPVPGDRRGACSSRVKLVMVSKHSTRSLAQWLAF